jgi:hypothetical protein
MELREKVLEASQRTLGSEHPDTLSAMDSLANSYSDVGRWQEAMELREKVEANQRTLGSEHPDTLRAMNNLTNLPIKKLKKLNKLIGWFKRL